MSSYGALAGFALGGVGTGLTMAGDRQRQQAISGVLDYQDQSINEKNARDQEAARAAADRQFGYTRDKFAALQQMLGGYTGPTTDPRAQQRITDTVGPQMSSSNSWYSRAAAPIQNRTNQLVQVANNAAQQDAQGQQRQNALAGFTNADQNLRVQSQDANELASVEQMMRDRAWQQRLQQIQRLLYDAQSAGDDMRLAGQIVGMGGQAAGAYGAYQNAGQYGQQPNQAPSRYGNYNMDTAY